MAFLIACAIVVAIGAIYALARPYLIEHYGFWREFCAWVDPIFVTLFTKSRQIAVARLTGIGGILVAVVTEFGNAPIDWNVIGEFVVGFFPLAWQGFAQKLFVPVAIWFGGELFRRVTTKPVSEKE